MSGYARAYRKRWEHCLFKNKQEAAVWAWMTDTARWRAHSFQTRFGMVTLGRGQLLVSERTVAEDFGLGRQQVRRLMDSFETAGMINRDTTHSASRAGTIVTIVNYERFQGDEGDRDEAATQGQPVPQPKGNPRPTQDQPTREEGEEREEGKKRPSVSSPVPGAVGSGEENGGQVLTFTASPASAVPSLDEVSIAFAQYETFRRDIVPGVRPLQLSPDRRQKLAARLREIGGLEGWRNVIETVRASSFLLGEGARGGRLVATIDWLINPTNLRKTLEGNYDERPRNGQRGRSAPTSPVDAMRAARAAVGRR